MSIRATLRLPDLHAGRPRIADHKEATMSAWATDQNGDLKAVLEHGRELSNAEVQHRCYIPGCAEPRYECGLCFEHYWRAEDDLPDDVTEQGIIDYFAKD